MSAYRDAVNAFRRDLLATTVAAHPTYAQAAVALGLHRNHLRGLLRQHGVGGRGTPGRPRTHFVASDPRATGSVRRAGVSVGGRGEAFQDGGARRPERTER